MPQAPLRFFLKLTHYQRDLTALRDACRIEFAGTAPDRVLSPTLAFGMRRVITPRDAQYASLWRCRRKGTGRYRRWQRSAVQTKDSHPDWTRWSARQCKHSPSNLLWDKNWTRWADRSWCAMRGYVLGLFSSMQDRPRAEDLQFEPPLPIAKREQFRKKNRTGKPLEVILGRVGL
jgi:hypothetical protein